MPLMPNSEDEGEEDEFMVDGPAPFENNGAEPMVDKDEDSDADEEQEDEDNEDEEGEEEGEANEEDDQRAEVPVAKEAESHQTAQKKRKAETLTSYSDGSEDEKEDETLNQPNDFSRAPMSAASLGLKTTPPDVVAEEDAAQLPAREQQANASGAQKGEEVHAGRGKKGATQSNGVFVPAVVDPAIRELTFVLPSKGQMWTRVPMEDCLHAVARDDDAKLIQPFEVEWTDLEATKKDQKDVQTKITDANATHCLRSLLIFDMPVVERQSVQTQNKSNKMACLPVKIKIPAEEAHREILQKFEELQASTGKCANVLWALEHSIVKKLYKLSNNGLPSDFDPYKHASINYVIPNTPHKLCEINPKWTLLDTNGKEAGGKAGKSGSGRGRGGGGAKKQRKAPEASAPTTDKLDDANGSQQIAKTVQDKLPFTAPEAGKAALAQTKRKNKQMREAEGIVSVPHSSTKTTASQIQLNFTKSAPPAAATTDVSDTSGDTSVETAITERQPTPASKGRHGEQPYSSEDDEDEPRSGDKGPIAHPHLMKIQNDIRPYTTGLELLDSSNNSLCRTHVFKLFNDKQKLANASICGNYLYVTVTEDPDDGS